MNKSQIENIEELTFSLTQEEEDLISKLGSFSSKSSASSKGINIDGKSYFLGLSIGVSNKPVAINLLNFFDDKERQPYQKFNSLLGDNDLYAIIYAVGIVRAEGNAKIKKIRFHATSSNKQEVTTLGQIPSTEFKERFSANVTVKGALGANGSISADTPLALTGDTIPLTGDVKLTLSTTANFVGEISMVQKVPIVQSRGFGTNECEWIIAPDKNPLLGDQLFLQIALIPKGLKSLTMQLTTRIVAHPTLGDWSLPFNQEKEINTTCKVVFTSNL